MPADATEGVGESNSRQQPSINLHTPVTAFMSSCSGTQMYYPEGMKAWVSPELPLKPYRILAPTRSGLEPGTSRSTVQSSNHYYTAAHYTLPASVINPGMSNTTNLVYLHALIC